MSGAIELFGWFVFNVAIPLLAPLALLSLVSVPDFFRAHRHGMLRYAIKDGQLFWVAIPMSASACHMLASVVRDADTLRLAIWMVLTCHVGIIVAASVMVVFATMDAQLEARSLLKRAPRVPWISIWMASMSAVLHGAGYIYLIHPHALT